jgi:hypothetical protein
MTDKSATALSEFTGEEINTCPRSGVTNLRSEPSWQCSARNGMRIWWECLETASDEGLSSFEVKWPQINCLLT